MKRGVTRVSGKRSQPWRSGTAKVNRRDGSATHRAAAAAKGATPRKKQSASNEREETQIVARFHVVRLLIELAAAIRIAGVGLRIELSPQDPE